MQPKPPPPVCKCFLVCRQLLLDHHSRDYVILAQGYQIHSFTFPAVVDMSVYARLSSVQGVYQLEVQLQDLEGKTLWQQDFGPLLRSDDPLQIGVLDLQHLQVVFPKPGKYELVLLANGEEIVRDVFLANLRTSSGVP